MSNNDLILKKSIAFERLAVNLDSKSFLKSLSQSVVRQPIDFHRDPSPVRQPTSFTRVNPGSFTDNSGFDPELVGKYENLDEFGNPKTDGIPPVPAPAQFDTATAPNSYTLPTTNITGTYPPIAPEVQNVLSTLTGIPLAADGKIGDNTRKAINAFKAKYNVGNLSNKELEKAILRTWYETTQPKVSGPVASR